MDGSGTDRGPWTRGRLARATGCNAETVRYYEKIGLLPAPDRSAAGYRLHRPTVRGRPLCCGRTFLAAGRNWRALEGEPPGGSVVIIAFESPEAIRAWWDSPGYREAHAIRERTATSRSFIVEGCDIEPFAGDGPAGYYIGERDVRDDDAYKEYVRQATPVVAAFGGAYMIRAGRWESLEGAEPMGRVVALRFPSVARCEEWFRSDEYHPVHKIRVKAATSRTYLMEGVS